MTFAVPKFSLIESTILKPEETIPIEFTVFKLTLIAFVTLIGQQKTLTLVFLPQFTGVTLTLNRQNSLTLELTKMGLAFLILAVKRR
jgi:hypothetical protein